jgi:hypothetical protein
MGKVADKLGAVTDTRPAGWPTWKPTYPGEQPPQELVGAVLAQDKQRLQQIRDPNLQLLMLKLAAVARQSEDQAVTRLECFLAQADALMNYANNSIPLARELDILKDLRGGLIALQDYNAGSYAKLRVLRGKAPNKTKPKRPSEARQRALIRLFVHVLTIGGTQNGALEDVKAEKKVAKFASDNGLKRERLGVRGVCVDIDLGEDREAADLFETLKAATLPTDVRKWPEKDRLGWVKRRAPTLLKI